MLWSSVVQCSSLFIFRSYLRLSFESFTLPARAGDAFMAVELTSLATVYFGLLRSELSFSSFVHPTVCLFVRLPDCVSVCLSVCRCVCPNASYSHSCTLLSAVPPLQLGVCYYGGSFSFAFCIPLYFPLSLSLCCRFLSFIRFVSF